MTSSTTTTSRIRRATTTVAATAIACATIGSGTLASAQESHGAHAAPRAGVDARPLRLFDGLGRHTRPIATTAPIAQRWFDQGLRLAYAFNHAEALRSFREAARLDPSCAMCQWGIAYVLGPNVNAPMDAASYPEAHAAATRASSLAAGGPARDRALIEALVARYAPNAPAAGRAALDSAYAAAMQRVAARWPADADVATLHAESVMLLSPWVYWTASREPRAGTTALVAALERAMRQDRNHPGACHYYIHAVEAAFPARALPCAERLAALMPAAGHIVHMPGHIYLRVGRYNDAITANRHALHADETYLADGGRGGFYAVAYYPHNSHFLAFAAMMAGRSADAVAAAREASRNTPNEAAEGVPELQFLVAYPHLALATFGDWSALAREPMPSPRLRVATALAWFARGLGEVRAGRIDGAAAALDSVRAIAGAESRYPAAPVLGIATRVLAGELSGARGDRAAQVAQLEAATALEDSLTYMEPPYWHQPVRHVLGAALLASGRPAEASRRYREDLERFPKNVWSLAGLERALTAEGRIAEAASVRARLRRATRQSDVQVTASRF